MPNDSSVPEPTTVGACAKAFHRASQAAMETVLRRHDLGPTQWYVLYHLTHDGPTTQRDLALTLRLERATLSGVVRSLVRKGLVEQTTDDADRRRRRLTLTAVGKQVWQELPDPIALIADVAFTGTSRTDLDTAMRVLRGGTRRLSEYQQEVRPS